MRRTFLPLMALGACAFGLALLVARPADAELGVGGLTGLDRFGPSLQSEKVITPRSPLHRVRTRGQLLGNVRVKTYGRVEPPEAITEAGEVLTRRLRPYAEGLYVTSLTRTPADQRRLMKTSHTKGWAINRSKHLMGMAIDIGWVSRRVSSWELRDRAEEILVEELGEERAGKLRVVRERRCIHVEVDTWRGHDMLAERIGLLEEVGALKRSPEDDYPVPKLRDYVDEKTWRQRPARLVTALPH